MKTLALIILLTAISLLSCKNTKKISAEKEDESNIPETFIPEPKSQDLSIKDSTFIIEIEDHKIELFQLQRTSCKDLLNSLVANKDETKITVFQDYNFIAGGGVTIASLILEKADNVYEISTKEEATIILSTKDLNEAIDRILYIQYPEGLEQKRNK